jgi:hypothetical protein
MGGREEKIHSDKKTGDQNNQGPITFPELKNSDGGKNRKSQAHGPKPGSQQRHKPKKS